MNNFLLFSGTSNRPLAQKIAQILKLNLGNIEITRFIDNECRVCVNDEIAGNTVFVIQSLSQIADQNLVELCLIGQALYSLKAKLVTAVIPWLGYSKQDKEFRRGEAVSAQLVAKFIEVAGFNQVLTIQLHSEKLVPYFKIPVTELSTSALLAHAANLNTEMVVVSPDQGGKSRSEKFAQEANLTLVYLKKERNLTTGEVKITGITGDVAGKEIVIFDDIINTGETAIRASEFLKNHGAKKIYFLATHAVLAGLAIQNLKQSVIDQLVVTDTIFIPSDKQISKLKVVSVAPLLAAEIRNMIKQY